MKKMIRNSTAEFLIFTSQAGEDGIEVRYQGETIWLSQKMMAALFGCSTDNISLHLKNIFKEGELEKKSVTEDFSITASDGKNYKTKHYNLDTIIACGYRINSARAKRLDAFLEFDERKVLTDSGRIAANIAKGHAESEFEKYRIVQDRLFESDFDKIIKEINKK